MSQSFYGNEFEYGLFQVHLLSIVLKSRDYKNLLKESSVISYSEGMTCSLTSRHNHFQTGCSIVWRDLSPAVDLEIERIFNNHCSKSMINECRPSLKSSIFSIFTLGKSYLSS